MRLAVICTLILLSSQSSALAAPVNSTLYIPLDAERRDINKSVTLFRRGKGKWVHYSELQKPENQHFKVKVNKFQKRKSVIHKVAHGVEKKPFLTFAIVGSGLFALNTYIVAESIRRREEKIMNIKARKGELPVVLPDPTPPPPKKEPSSKKQESSPPRERTQPGDTSLTDDKDSS